jgi:hypothetical protein
MKISIFYVKAIVLTMIMFALLCGLVADLKAQTYNLSVGTNVSTYLFKNSEGVSVDFLKRGSGSHFQLGSEWQLLDTTNDYSSSSKKAIYFSQRQGLARFLTRVKLDLQIESNQFNAVGDEQNIAFSYQTNFIGLSGGLGFQTPNYKNWTLTARGRFAGQKLIQGNQALGNKYLDLTKDDQFSPVQIFGGFAVQVQKKLADRISAFLEFQQMQTMHGVVAGKPTLNFQNSTIGFGIKILK